MGGRVSVESQPGEGSRFTVQLPRRSCDAAAEPDVSCGVGMTHGARDGDDHGRRRTTSRAATRSPAGSSAEAIGSCWRWTASRRSSIARSALPDLILMDLGLPGIDGWEATRQLEGGRRDAAHSAHRPERARDDQRPRDGAGRRRRRLRHQAGPVRAAAGEDRVAARERRPRRDAARLAARRRRQRAQPGRAVPPSAAARVTTSPWRRTAPRRWRSRPRRAFDLVLLDVEMPGLSGLDVLTRAARARARRRELPVIMVTARTAGRGHRRGVPPGRQRLRHQADRFPGRARADRARTSSHKRAVESLRESEERYALAMQRRQRRPVGLEPDDQRGLLVGRGGRRCSATTERRSASSPEEWFSPRAPRRPRARPRGAGGAPVERQRPLRERAPDAPPRRDVPLGALPRRGHPQRGGDGDAPGRIADRHHRRQGRRRADRAAEPAAVRRPAGPRDQADRAAPGVPVRAARARSRPLQGGQRTASGC